MCDIIKPIKNTNRYFISKLGYAFKIVGKREVRIPLNIIRGVPKVKIEDKKLNMVNIQIEHFSDSPLPTDSIVSFKIIDGMVPFDKIKIRHISHLSEDESLIIKYKCDVKASSQNTRVKNISTITKFDVLNSLKRTEFKCFYCGDSINPKTWHLDHVHPLSKGGQNIFTNITPSCRICNLIKHDLPIDQFILACRKISENNKYHHSNLVFKTNY